VFEKCLKNFEVVIIHFRFVENFRVNFILFPAVAIVVWHYNGRQIVACSRSYKLFCCLLAWENSLNSASQVDSCQFNQCIAHKTHYNM